MPLINSAYGLLERLGLRPREFYTFAQGGKMWRYSSANRKITVTYPGSHIITYDAGLISRDRFERSQDTGAITVHCKVARTVPVAAAMQENHTFPMALGIHRHQMDTNTPIVMAYGDVAAIQQNGGWVEFDLLTGDAAFNQPFPRLTIDNLCQWQFTSGDCGVDAETIKHETTLISIDKSTILVADIETGRPDGWYDGGRIIWNREEVFIEKQIANELHIFGLMPTGSALADPVTLIPGCDKSMGTCITKWDNVFHHMGFPYLPISDPYTTGLP